MTDEPDFDRELILEVHKRTLDAIAEAMLAAMAQTIEVLADAPLVIIETEDVPGDDDEQ